MPVARNFDGLPYLAGLAGYHMSCQAVAADDFFSHVDLCLNGNCTDHMPLATEKSLRQCTPPFLSPIFLKVDVAFNFSLRLVYLETALLKDFDDAGRLRIDVLTSLGIFLRHADHLGIAAQIN